MRLALINPLVDAPSETFIAAHRDMLDAEVCRFWGAPWFLECDGAAVPPLKWRWLRNLARGVSAPLVGPCAPGQPRILPAESVALARAFRAKQIDVVLAEFGPTAVQVLPACVAAGVPMVVHFHGFDASRRTTLADFGAGYPAVFAYASTIVVVSRAMEKALLDMGAPAEKVLLNPYGPRERFFVVTPSLGSRTVIAVGRFVAKKGPLQTLRAFAIAANDHPDARLVLAGDGPLLGAAQALAHQLGLAERVSFPGVVTHDAVQRLMAEAAIFAQHSVVDELGDSEGTPVALLEAHAAGLPVVSTRHAGIPEAVIDGSTGLLVDEGDEAGMAMALGRLLGDPDLARRMGQAGRAHVRSNYSLRRHIELLDGALAAAVSSSRTAPDTSRTSCGADPRHGRCGEPGVAT